MDCTNIASHKALLYYMPWLPCKVPAVHQFVELIIHTDSHNFWDLAQGNADWMEVGVKPLTSHKDIAVISPFMSEYHH